MNQLGNFIYYDDEFFKNVMSLLAHYQVLKIDTKCILLEDTGNQAFLEEMISLYLSLKIQENHQDIIPKEIEIKEVAEIANNILLSIFPKFHKEIMQYDQLLRFYDDFSFSNSCYHYQVTEEGIVIPQSIDISMDFNEYTISTMNHEKTHVLLMEKLNLNKFPTIYMELLPIFIQKITNHHLMNQYDLPNISIIDDIVHTIDNQKHINTLDYLREIDKNQESLESHFVYDYLNIKANEYLIADWYSELLFQDYLIDSNSMKIKLEKLLTSEITIQQFLDYYNITLQNKELIPMITQKLEKVKKYNIKL